jgi:tetratricopeptide (TPR) repeat protein
MPVPRPFLRPILATAFLSLSSLALAATGGWRAELDAAELYSDRDQTEAKSQLDVLREQFTVQKQDDALSYADAIDCFFLINTEPNKAPRFAEEALARAKALRYPDAFIRLTTCRGSAKEQTGNLDGARQDYQVSIDLAREARRPLAQADAMGYLADLISYQGKAAESMALVREAVALLDSQPGAIGDPVLQRIRRGLLGRMANIYVRTDEPAKAAAYYEQVLAEDERLGNRQALISDLYTAFGQRAGGCRRGRAAAQGR